LKLFESRIVESTFESDDNEVEYENGKSNEHESENLTSSECGKESNMHVLAAAECSP